MYRTPEFYALNATRSYPIDDAATGDDDSGYAMPCDVLTDCAIRFPKMYGDYVFVSSLHVSPYLVSVAFAISHRAAHADETTSAFIPLGVVSVPRTELIESKQYPIEPLQDGVAGWVVFGPCQQKTTYSGRFSSVDQSMLVPRTCRAYAPMPVTSMGAAYDAQALTDTVTIAGSTDISVAVGYRNVEGYGLVKGLIFSLRGGGSNATVLQQYAGPCARRPENKNCSQRNIESINGVTPDCDGNIKLTFKDALQAILVGGYTGGLTLDYGLGLATACTTVDPAAVECQETMPYEETFEDGKADYFVPQKDTWVAGLLTYRNMGEGDRAVTILRECVVPPLDKRLCTTRWLWPDNGAEIIGIVFGYTCDTYYVAEIAHVIRDEYKLRIRFHSSNDEWILVEETDVVLQRSNQLFTLELYVGTTTPDSEFAGLQEMTGSYGPMVYATAILTGATVRPASARVDTFLPPPLTRDISAEDLNNPDLAKLPAIFYGDYGLEVITGTNSFSYFKLETYE